MLHRTARCVAPVIRATRANADATSGLLKAVAMSTDQNPQRTDEVERIIAAKGMLANWHLFSPLVVMLYRRG